MLLRITALDQGIRVEYFGKEKFSYEIDSFDPPGSKNYQKSLQHYFSATPPAKDPQVVEKMIAHGRMLADSLLGEDFELFKIAHLVETDGVQDLDVEICSVREEFFKLDFETLILPDTDYILSCVCKSFSRISTIDPPTTMSIQESESLTHTALNVLYLASPPDVESAENSSVYELLVKSVGFAQKMQFDVLCNTSIDDVSCKLDDGKAGINIIHYEGGIRIIGEKIQLTFGGAEPQTMDLDDILPVFSRANIKTLVLGLTASESDGVSIKPSVALAAVAKRCSELNIVGQSHLSNGWTRTQVFAFFYEYVTMGYSISQAVMETRKRLQKEYQHHALFAEPLDFHSWLLPCSLIKYDIRYMDAPANTEDPLSAPQPYAGIKQKLFGFDDTLLPPNCASYTSSSFLEALSYVSSDDVLAIYGESGTGKTHLAYKMAFYWLASEQCEYAFYFDFREHFYTRENVLEMIAPIFGLEQTAFAEVEKQLENIACCFVFDEVSYHVDDANQDDVLALHKFLGKLAPTHQLVVLNREMISQEPFNGRWMSLGRCDEGETQLLAAGILRDIGLAEKEAEPEYADILAKTSGNPLLIRRSMLALLSNSSRDTLAALSDIDSVEFNDNKAQGFLKSRWETLSPSWQKLILLMRHYDSVYIELLATTVDSFDAEKRPDFSAISEFKELLGFSEKKLSEGVAQLEASGFLVRKGYGRLIDASVKSYLAGIYNDYISAEYEAQATQLMNQIWCEGLRVYAPMMRSGENQMLLHHLIGNRGVWAKCLEALWFDLDFHFFFACKNVLDSILAQVNLQKESNLWAFDLLKRTPSTHYSDRNNPEACVAWLTLATPAFTHQGAHESGAFQDAEKYFSSVIDSVLSDIETGVNAVLFNHIVTFLEGYYFSTQSWERCLTVSEKAYNYYLDVNKAPRIIRSLKSMALCSRHMHKHCEAQSLEEEMLKLLWDSNNAVPEQTCVMLSFECLESRIATDPSSAQALLDDIQHRLPKPQLDVMFQRYQADVHFALKHYEKAVEIYVDVLENAGEHGQVQAMEKNHIEQKLMHISEKLGRERFDEICAINVDAIQGPTLQ